MVKRVVGFILPVLFVAWPASAQDFSRIDVAFGYGNYGVESSDGLQLTTDRAHGFAMQTGINLMSWLGFENYTGAYALDNDVTLITSTFGGKLVARDLIEGRISPYLVAGFGVGYYTSNQTGGGFSTMAARYAGGVDFNLNGAMALRVDVGRLALGSGLFTDGWRSNLNVSTGIVFNLGN